MKHYEGIVDVDLMARALTMCARGILKWFSVDPSQKCEAMIRNESWSQKLKLPWQELNMLTSHHSMKSQLADLGPQWGCCA